MRRIAFACLIATSGVSAQPVTIDVDVVHALVEMMGQPIGFVDAAPDSLRPLLPDGAEVLGALVPETPGPFTSVVARLEDEPAAAAEAFRARGVRDWEIRSPESERGGFAASDRFEVSVSRGGTEASLVFMARPRGLGSLVVLVVQPAQRGGGLDWEMEAVGRHLPVLIAPPGDTQRVQGGGGSLDYQVNRTTLESGLALEAVVTHYNRQMAAAGWTPVTYALEADHAFGVWTQTIEGEPLIVTLQITPGGAAEYALTLVLTGAEQ